MRKQGEVILIGAGPGSPDLLTIRAFKEITRAEVVLYDRLVGPEIPVIAPINAIKHCVGKVHGQDQTNAQDRIIHMMIAYAQRGMRVVRLKGGDPFVFGRGSEEYLALRSMGIAVRTVPGISSVLAAAHAGGSPLTHRGLSSSFAVYTGSSGKNVNQPAGTRPGTHVFLMGVKAMARIAYDMLSQGIHPSTPVTVVESVSLPNQRITTAKLDDLAALAPGFRAPATLIIGETAGLLMAPESFAMRAS